MRPCFLLFVSIKSEEQVFIVTKSRQFFAVFLLSGLFFLSLPAGDLRASRVPYYVQADYVLVEKEKRRMTLYRAGRVIRRYQVSLGKGGLDPKMREGDMLTPEGLYHIDTRNPESAYHLSLRISYPGPEDLRRAQRLGVSPGGDIMIHGLASEADMYMAHKRTGDWTEGCIAVSNAEIEEIWHLVPDGTPIAIRP
jgi:murein L,D-transpeptidase YafK